MVSGAREEVLALPRRRTHISRAPRARIRSPIMGWILLVVVFVAIWFVVSLYNRLVGARNGYKNAFAQIDVQLTRRYDLIPNLVEIAKGYIEQGREAVEGGHQALNHGLGGLKAAAANPGDA